MTYARLGLRFEKIHDDYLMWKKAITSKLQSFAATEQKKTERKDNAYDKSIKRGILRRRPARGGDMWDEYFFALTNSELLVMERSTTSERMQILEMFELHSNCSVFDTNLLPFSFEVVTPKGVLHLKSDSTAVTSSWVASIRGVIAASVTHEDPLLHAALDHIDSDVFYSVSFTENKPLGIVLERAGEWATVKLSSARDTGVAIGSALTSINEKSVMLTPYHATIDKLKNWRPPLTLGFRRAPSKSGYLVKLSRQRRGTNQNWQRRYFVMDEGRLVYKENAEDTAVKGDIPLMGSAVSLVSSAETGKFFCFKVVSGVTQLTMQGETMDEMMQWASKLYHAIAIANGGSHILVMERKRVDEENERNRVREEAIAAKRKADQLKAEAEAKERAEREARARAAQEESVRRAALAQVERLRLEEEDRKNQAIEDSTHIVYAALTDGTIESLTSAIEKVGFSEFASQITPLQEAREVLARLEERERLVKEARNKAQDGLVGAVGVATVDTVDSLDAAIMRAEECGVDEEVINPSRIVLRQLEQQRAMIEEVRTTLKQAVSLEMVDTIKEALASAAAINYSGVEVESAKLILNRLEDEEKIRVLQEQERLAAEAAALDAAIAIAAATVNTAEDNEIEQKVLKRLSTVCFSENDDHVESDGDDDFIDDLDEEEQARFASPVNVSPVASYSAAPVAPKLIAITTSVVEEKVLYINHFLLL